MDNIVLYSTGCPKCNVVIAKLNKAGLNYEVCNDTNKMEQLGIDQLPVLEVNGELMEFAKAVKWIGECK